MDLQSSSKAVDIPSGIGAALGSGDGREADVGRGLLALLGEERSGRQVAKVAVACKGTVGTEAAGVDDTLRNLLLRVSHRQFLPLPPWAQLTRSWSKC